MARTIHLRPITPFVPNKFLSDKHNEYNRIRWEAHNEKLKRYHANKGWPIELLRIESNAAALLRRYPNVSLHADIQARIASIKSEIQQIKYILGTKK